MKRVWMSLALIAAMTMGLGAQGTSFEKSVSAAAAPAIAVEASVPAAVAAPQASTTTAEREWLFLVFINGVNDLGILGYANSDINEMEAVGSTDRVAVVAEFGILGVDNTADRNLQFQRGSKTIYVTRDNNATDITSPVIASSNEADMGSEASLVRFVQRALRRYPAKKVALVLWNHGSGTLGISHDDVTNNEMSVDKLGAALAYIEKEMKQKVDLFATDACLMQMAAVAYQFSGHTGVIVGSEETVPGNGYPYAPILSSLTAKPSMDAEELGSIIVDAYGNSYANDATLSALNSEMVQQLPNALSSWLGAVMSDETSFKAAAGFALVNSVSRFSYRDSKDLVDYIDKVSAAPGVPDYVKQEGRNLREFITRGMVIRNAAKPRSSKAYTKAAGLAIYMPMLRYNSAAYEKLSFPGQSLWGEFVLKVMKERLK